MAKNTEDYLLADTREWALYKGEDILAEGTLKEIAKQTGVKVTSLIFYRSDAYRRRMKPNGNSRSLICLDD